jgi:hypothetical protein
MRESEATSRFDRDGASIATVAPSDGVSSWALRHILKNGPHLS